MWWYFFVTPVLGARPITLNNNGSVCFSGNTASDYAGAVGGELCNVTLSNNASVSFIENKAFYGGAIFGFNIELNNNGSVLFSGNKASGSDASGGAIYTSGSLHIRNNDSVEFAGNVEKRGGPTAYAAYTLKAVVAMFSTYRRRRASRLSSMTQYMWAVALR